MATIGSFKCASSFERHERSFRPMVVTTWEPPSIGRGDGTRGAPAVETTDVRARLHGKPALTVGDGAMQRSDRQPGVPMKRIGAMSAVPSAARWLASHKSKDVTGVVLPVDRGLACKG